MNRFALGTIAVAAIAASITAVAQDASATLEVGRGVVMTSSGGEFVTAHSGQRLGAGERVMVSKDASATVVFGTCRRTYDRPGVYAVGEGCSAVAAAGAGTTGNVASGGGFGGAGVGGTAAFVAATAVAAGVIAHNINSDNDGEAPISR